MATQRQIEANQRNAARSTGPSTPEGRSRSSKNATKHGLAAVLPGVDADSSPEFRERRAKWAAERNPVGQAGNWALDRVIAATFRIEECEKAVDQATADFRERAALAWEEDRAVEAATIFGRLGKDPILASRQLQTTLAGVGLLIEAWLGLVSVLEVGDWSESEEDRALDLLGVAPDLRSRRTLIDAPEGADAVAFHRELAFEELERLETLRDESLAPLDELDRRRAMAGHLALLSKPTKLILRYERDAWRRYHQGMKELQGQAPTPAAAPAPSPAAASRPEVRKPAVAEPAPRVEEKRRALPVEVAPIRDGVFAGLDRRSEGRGLLPTGYVPIAIGVRPSIG